MLGLAHHNIAVVSIIIDRKVIWSHTIKKLEPDWPQQLSEFLSKSEISEKTRVIMLDDVSFLNRLKTESSKNMSMFDSCVFLVFDTPENLSSMSSLNIVDATKAGDSWRYHKVVPAKLNDMLVSADKGLVVSAKPVDSVKPSKSETNSVKSETSKVLSVIFEPNKDLFFQHIENCLVPCAEEHQRQILRQLIAAWFEGGLSDDYGTRITKRMEKYGGNVVAYSELEYQANELGYADNLKVAARAFASADKDKSMKEIAQTYSVRLGDLKWLNANWPFSNLVISSEFETQGDSKEA